MMIIGAPDDCLAAPNFWQLHYMCMQQPTNTEAKTKTRKTHPQTKRDQTNRDQPPPYPRATAKKKKKKQVREPDLGVVVDHGVRVQEGERGHDEETQGESQTPEKGFGFPQHLRKRDREKTAPTKIPNTKERERGQQTSGHAGVRSWRATNQTPFQSQRQKKNTKQSTQHPAKRNLT